MRVEAQISDLLPDLLVAYNYNHKYFMRMEQKWRDAVADFGSCHFQVGHEPLPPTVGTTMFGRRVLYLPGFFSYGE